MLGEVRRHRPSHATVVAYLALFVALGGSSYAAVTLKRNSVKQRHIARNAVTSVKVKNSTLLARDFAPGQLPAALTGPQGPPGQPGAPGSPGLSGYKLVSNQGPSSTQSTKQHAVTCPPGKKPIGGGFSRITTAGGPRPVAIRSQPTLDGWSIQATDLKTDGSAPSASGWYVIAHVICANVVP